MARPTYETVARVGQPSSVQAIVRRSLRQGVSHPYEVVVYRPNRLTPVRKIIRIGTIQHAIGIADVLYTDPTAECPTPEQAAEMAEENHQ